ncbi:MAG: hypothetical protein DMG30_18310 [Acidobacteria bacterium]|nr:MAG: hypothetical protein DMG30_18310 [Acidobacteriota bacterium]
MGAIVADYSLIRWWSDTMNATAKKLAEMQAFLAQHPNALGVARDVHCVRKKSREKNDVDQRQSFCSPRRPCRSHLKGWDALGPLVQNQLPGGWLKS